MIEVELHEQERKRVRDYAEEQGISFEKALGQIIKVGLEDNLAQISPSTMAIKHISQGFNK